MRIQNRKIASLVLILGFVFAALTGPSAQTPDQAAFAQAMGGTAPTIAPQIPTATQLTAAPLAIGSQNQTLTVSASSLEQMFSAMASGIGSPAQNLEQFGYSIFNAPSTPSLVAIGDDYLLGPGDSLILYLWGDAVDIKELSSSYVLNVDRNGAIFLPPVGQVSVWGQDLGTVKTVLKSMLDRRYKRLELNLTLGTIRQFPVFVSGYAGQPGTILATGADTVLSVLSRAGGIRRNGSLRSIVLTRSGKGNTTEKITIDLYESLLEGKPLDLRVREGDAIFIPAIGPVVALAGEVKRPGIYEIKKEKNLTQALPLSGGSLPSARSKAVTLLRYSDAGKTLITGDLSDAGFTNNAITDGDFIYFGKVSDLLIGQTAVSGAVKYPGKYELSTYKTLKALLDKTQLVPETNIYYGRVYRVDQMGRDVSFAFSPRDIMENASADIPLAEFDRIVLYRYNDTAIDADFDHFVNTIVVSGTAKYAGYYLYKEGMKLSEILTADQLLLDTNENYGEIVRLRKDGKNEYLTFRPGEVINGKYDLTLGPRDVIRLVKVGYKPAQLDVDRFVDSVVVEGPVEFGGVYAWKAGMKLAELISLAKPRLETNRVYAEIVRPLAGGKNEYVTFALREVEQGAYDTELKARDRVRLFSTQAVLTVGKAGAQEAGTAGTEGAGTAAVPAAGTGAQEGAATPAAAAQATAQTTPTSAGNPQGAAPAAMGSGIETDLGAFLEVVQVSGTIRYQGPYARTPSLKLSSVVTAEQILEETNLEYAELTRLKADGTLEYLTFAPKEVLQNTFDLDLRAKDFIRFYPKYYLPAKINFDRFSNAIAIVGTANYPGLYSLSKPSMLSEFINAKQLMSNTDIHYAEIERWVTGGRTDYLTFSPLAVLSGEQDIRIFPRDIIRLVTAGNTGENHDFAKFADTVLVKGTIRYPGRYAWYDGMALSSIIQVKDILVDTDTTYAEVKRNENGKESIFSFAIADIMAQKLDIQLKPRDIVQFYPKYYNKPVTVAGEVREPKVIPYFADMELSAVLRSVTLNKDLTELKAVIRKSDGKSDEVFLEDYLKRQPDRKVMLAPGDSVTIKSLLPDEHLASVIVRGEVEKPQTLAFTQGMRLADALKASGGYSPNAYPYGLVLIRKTVADAQQKQVDRLIAQLDAATVAGSALPTSSDSSLNSSSAVIANMQIDLAIQKSKLGYLKQLYKEGFGRITLDVPATIEELSTSKANILLERDDVIFVPQTPTYVLVSGEIASQNVVLYQEGMTVRTAIAESGWLSKEADIANAYIIRANGRLDSTEGKGFWIFKPNILRYQLKPGDTVYVPAKSVKVSLGWAYLRDSLLVVGNILTSALTAKTLLGL